MTCTNLYLDAVLKGAALAGVLFICNSAKCLPKRVKRTVKLVMNINGIKGFTIIELMLVVSVMGILLAVGLPSLQNTVSRISTNTQAKTLVSSLSFARSEAIKRGGVVSICASSNGTDCAADAWGDGWAVFIDNNGDADGAAGSIDVGDQILRVYQGLGSNSLVFDADIQQFDPRGFGTNAGVRTFLLCPEDDNAANAQSVEISFTGRGRRIHEGLDCS